MWIAQIRTPVRPCVTWDSDGLPLTSHTFPWSNSEWAYCISAGMLNEWKGSNETPKESVAVQPLVRNSIRLGRLSDSLIDSLMYTYGLASNVNVSRSAWYFYAPMAVWHGEVFGTMYRRC